MTSPSENSLDAGLPLLTVLSRSCDTKVMELPSLTGKTSKQIQAAEDIRSAIIRQLTEGSTPEPLSQEQRQQILDLVTPWTSSGKWFALARKPLSSVLAPDAQQPPQLEHQEHNQEPQQEPQEPLGAPEQTPPSRSWLGFLPRDPEKNRATLQAIHDDALAHTSEPCTSGLNNLTCEFRAGHHSNHRATFSSEGREYRCYWSDAGYYSCVESV